MHYHNNLRSHDCPTCSCNILKNSYLETYLRDGDLVPEKLQVINQLQQTALGIFEIPFEQTHSLPKAFESHQCFQSPALDDTQAIEELRTLLQTTISRIFWPNLTSERSRQPVLGVRPRVLTMK